MRRLGLGQRTGLVGARLGGLDLGPGFRLAEGDVARGVDLDLLCFGLPDGGLLVGRGLDHAGVAGHRGHALLAEQLDVVRLVGKALDRERVDL